MASPSDFVPSTSARGRTGEDEACRIISESGCKVLQRNFRTARGEVDIVAMEQSVLCFVEVKCWKRELWLDLGKAIGRNKRSRIRTTALAWLDKVTYKAPHEGIRFDVLVIDPDTHEHEWLKGALDFQIP